jgi:hypothetical protein
VVKQFGSANSSIVMVASHEGVGRLPQQRFRHGERVGCQRGDAITPSVGSGHQLGRRNDLLHKPQFEGPTRVDRHATREEGEGPLVAEPSGQRPRGADLGQQAKSAERRHDQRIVGGKHHVAGQCPGQADPCGRAVDRRHERGVAARDEPCHAAEFVADPAPDVGGPFLKTEQE